MTDREYEDWGKKEILRHNLPWAAHIAVDGRPGATYLQYVYVAHIGNGNRVIAIDPRRMRSEEMAAKVFYSIYVPLNQCPPGVREKFRHVPSYKDWRREQGL